MAVSLTLLGAATVLILVQPLLAGHLVDRTLDGTPSTASVLVLLALLIGQLVAEAVAHYRLDRTGERIVVRLRQDFTDRVVRLPIGVLDGSRTGDVLARGAADAGLIRDMPSAVGDIAFGAATLLGAGALMASIDAMTVGVVIAVMGVAFGAGSPFLGRIQRASLRRQAALGDYASGLDRTLSAARTVKLFGAEDREIASISTAAEAAYRAGVRIASNTVANRLLVRVGVTGAFLTIMLIDGRRVADGALSTGQFVSLFAFAMYAVFPITAGFTALATFRTASGAYAHLTAVTDQLPEDNPAPRVAGEPRAAGAVVPDTAPLVEFEHVSFAYGADPVLDDVSFTLEANQVTALIGPSGAGKSTILALLCRFHDPRTGSVRWRGHDIRGMPLADLRGRLGLLEQDAPVLHGTIRDNLLIADPDAADDDLWRVLGQAKLADEIARLPAQLDTAVAERGRSLSGGQRQRLALARAYLSHSELILMDEPTAHLDRANEYDVMANLLLARGNRSLLVVAHRLSTVTTADRILVLSHGRIQATGTHRELLHHSVYRDLIEHELSDRR